MKRVSVSLGILVILGLVLAGCTSPVATDFSSGARAAAAAASNGIVWNGASDKAVAVNIKETASLRNNASGTKIPSNAHSADFPGIYFIWDSKQKDNGYLKVEASVFDKYESFVLTSKESNTYWDFNIALQPGQVATADGCYVFYIPKVYNNKNINMVFIGGYELKPAEQQEVIVHLGFIGYYVNDGKIMNTSFYWQDLKEGDSIDWNGVDAAYADWVAQGGLEPDRTQWLTSGYASFTFDDYANIGFGDFNIGQLEDYYKSYYVDPGYKVPPVLVSYDRYLAYVKLWNDLYLRNDLTPADKQTLSADGGLAHYNALLAAYGAASLPPYYHFDNSQQALYDSWADQLEVGLKIVAPHYLGDDFDLAAYVKEYDIANGIL